MKVALIQTNLIWEDAVQNRKNFEAKINTIASDVDLIVLPEMFSTGFTMEPQVAAESANSESLTWMKKMASEKGIDISTVKGSGDNGRIVKKDIENYQPSAKPAASATVPSEFDCCAVNPNKAFTLPFNPILRS